MSETKPGVAPSPGILRVTEALESRGGRRRDTVLIARSSEIGIWHSEKSASNDVPWWIPPFGDARAIYRGFPHEELHTVLEAGLDVAPQSAFFATGYPDKAWEYPMGRSIPTMLVLDATHTERSWAIRPSEAPDTWMPDKTRYPNHYFDDTLQVHTRFETDRYITHFGYENMYGFWVPGDARAALLGVVIGGPRSTAVQMLEDLASRGSGAPGLVQLVTEPQ